MRAALASLCLALVSSLMALGLAESLVRVVRPQLIYRFPQGLFVSDEATSYALTPGFRGVIDTPEFRTAIQVNAQGWREDADIGPKPPGTTRILVLGDSFTMGVGVEGHETLAAQLERRLNQGVPPLTTEVINAGVAGYGTRVEVAGLEARGFAVAPDAILLVFFIGNDIGDNAAALQVVRDGYLMSGDGHPPTGWWERLRGFVNFHSQLFHLAEPWLDRLRGRGPAMLAELRDGFRAIYDPHSRAPGWAATEAALRRFATVTREANMRAGLVLMPEGLQVSPTLWKAALAETGIDPTAVQPLAPNERLREFARQLGVPVIDLSEALGAAGDGATWYFPQDHHLTAAGTTEAVNALVPFVRAWLAGGSAP